VGLVSLASPRKDTSMKTFYTVFDPDGNVVEHISISGLDTDQQLEQYLDTKQGCYALEDEDEGDSDWEYEADDNSYGTAKWS
jgi:hypothetical protein